MPSNFVFQSPAPTQKIPFWDDPGISADVVANLGKDCSLDSFDNLLDGFRLRSYSVRSTTQMRRIFCYARTLRRTVCGVGHFASTTVPAEPAGPIGDDK